MKKEFKNFVLIVTNITMDVKTIVTIFKKFIV